MLLGLLCIRKSPLHPSNVTLDRVTESSIETFRAKAIMRLGCTAGIAYIKAVA